MGTKDQSGRRIEENSPMVQDNRATILTIYLGHNEAEARAMVQPPAKGFVRTADGGIEFFSSQLCYQVRIQTIDKKESQ